MAPRWSRQSPYTQPLAGCAGCDPIRTCAGRCEQTMRCECAVASQPEQLQNVAYDPPTRCSRCPHFPGFPESSHKHNAAICARRGQRFTLSYEPTSITFLLIRRNQRPSIESIAAGCEHIACRVHARRNGSVAAGVATDSRWNRVGAPTPTLLRPTLLRPICDAPFETPHLRRHRCFRRPCCANVAASACPGAGQPPRLPQSRANLPAILPPASPR